MCYTIFGSFFMPILEGSYIYLLIFQIIVIAVLLVALIWLVIRRLRGLNFDSVAASTTTVVQDEALIKLSNQQKEKISSLEQELLKLENATSSIKALQDENASLKEKIKILEQKLLEYEILQEEIGTLSYLKLENEKLRKQILEQQNSQSEQAQSGTISDSNSDKEVNEENNNGVEIATQKSN